MTTEDFKKLHFILDDSTVELMTRITGVYNGMMEERRKSVTPAGCIVQRISNPLIITEFQLWFGKTNPKENGWTAAIGFVADFKSFQECEAVLDSVRHKLHPVVN